MMKNNLITDNQHGFVPGRNCITQLLVCLDDWTSVMESSEEFDVIYTDFSKAFDSVAHERLLVKLQNNGIKGDLLQWIRSFLSGRPQCVNVNGILSDWKDVISGVPQGSVIGPILFVIFINDMPDEVKESVCKLFADNCKLYRNVSSSGQNDLQKELLNLENWSTTWQLPFNATKCKVLHFGTHNANYSYRLNNHTLDSTKTEKDLGVIIDNELKYHVHAASATKKANQVLSIMKKSYYTRDAKTMPTLYKSMVRPHLEYGNAIWGPFYKKDIDMVESVQKRATKLIDTLKDKPYEDRLIVLDLPSMTYRRKRGDMILMYKLINGLVRLDFNIFFTPMRMSHTRGHSKRVFKKHATKWPKIDSFSHRVTNRWNSLSDHVINAPSTNIFKKRLDEFWSNEHYVVRDD